MSRKETTAKTTGVAKVPQPQGGALNAGGTPGNNGGRPPSEIRRIARLAFEERLPLLSEIADTGKRDGDRIKAIEVLANIGFGKDLSREVVYEKVAKTLEAIRNALPEEQAEALVAELRSIWT